MSIIICQPRFLSKSRKACIFGTKKEHILLGYALFKFNFSVNCLWIGKISSELASSLKGTRRRTCVRREVNFTDYGRFLHPLLFYFEAIYCDRYIFVSLHTSTCRDKLTDDNIFLKTKKWVNLTADSSFCKNLCCFLE